MSSSPVTAGVLFPRARTIESTINSIRAFVRPQDHGPRGRARVGLFLALAVLFVLTTTFNLVWLYSNWSHGYGYGQRHKGGFIASMVIQTLCSIGMLVLSTAFVREFITSFIVAMVGMCIYIFIECMDSHGDPVQPRVATWSVLTFWIVFVADAVTSFGFRLTTWLAKKIVEQDTGRIRLADDVLPHGPQAQEHQQQGQYRDSYSPLLPSSDQASGVVDGEASQPRIDANIDLEAGKQEREVFA